MTFYGISCIGGGRAKQRPVVGLPQPAFDRNVYSSCLFFALHFAMRTAFAVLLSPTYWHFSYGEFMFTQASDMPRYSEIASWLIPCFLSSAMRSVRGVFTIPAVISVFLTQPVEHPALVAVPRIDLCTR